MVGFFRDVQRPTGGLPYLLGSPSGRRREHHLCYQYNAFQFLKLAWLEHLKPSDSVAAVLPGLAKFLPTGVTASGACAEDCFSRSVEVDYYTAALAAALDEAARLGLAEGDLSRQAYQRVAVRQKGDGGFIYSAGDYGLLHDGRSYPRPMAMTLFHLLYGAGAGDGFPKL